MDAQAISSLYSQVNNYIYNNFVLFWSIIIGVFAVIGVALFFVVRSIVSTRVDKELGDIQARMKTIDNMQHKISKSLDLVQLEHGIWIPTIGNRPHEIEGTGSYFRVANLCLISGSVGPVKILLAEGTQAIIAGLPFAHSGEHALIVGNAYLTTSSGHRRCYSIQMMGRNSLSFISDAGTLRLGDIGEGSVLSFVAQYVI